MFAKVKERLDTGAKATARPGTGSGSGGGGGRPMPSIVGADMRVIGNLETPGEIHVEGTVDGDVACARLIIGATGTVHGKVTAESVRVHGKVDGAIDADEVFLLSGSEVLGDIFQGTLEIAPGALFEGAVRRRGSARPVPALQPPAVPEVEAERVGEFEPVEEPKADPAPAAQAAPTAADTPTAEEGRAKDGDPAVEAAAEPVEAPANDGADKSRKAAAAE